MGTRRTAGTANKAFIFLPDPGIHDQHQGFHKEKTHSNKGKCFT
jgi:hypothetical protein